MKVLWYSRRAKKEARQKLSVSTLAWKRIEFTDSAVDAAKMASLLVSKSGCKTKPDDAHCEPHGRPNRFDAASSWPTTYFKGRNRMIDHDNKQEDAPDDFITILCVAIGMIFFVLLFTGAI